MKPKLVDASQFKEAANGDSVGGLAVRKQFNAEIKAIDDNERIIEFVISTASVDREGDTIAVDGWDLEAYKKNPVVLFAHDNRQPPVAKSIDVSASGDQLRSRAQFTDKELYPFGYMIYRMYKEGFMSATSVGFRPTEWKFVDDDERGFGVDFTAQELLEYSAVPVPANPDALVEARGKGIDTTPMKEWAEKVLDEWEEHEGLIIPRSSVERLRKCADEKQKTVFTLTRKQQERLRKENLARVTGETKEVNLENEMKEKRAITWASAHADGTPKANRDDEWSGPEEIADADVDDLKVMCAWVDEKNEDIKSAYKLPHHRADGEHAVVWRGVTAAMGALLGSRGGVDIPDDERRAVYDHLAKHYEEFDEEPPEFKHVEEQALKGEEFEFDEEAGQLYKEQTEMVVRLDDEQLAEYRQLVERMEKAVAAISKAETEEEHDDVFIEIDEQEEKDEDDDVDMKDVAAIVKEVLAQELRKITGRLD